VLAVVGGIGLVADLIGNRARGGEVGQGGAHAEDGDR
jgi:hypothetical protein